MKRCLCLILIMILTAHTAFALSYEKEKEIADKLISNLEARGLIIHDRELDRMVQAIADSLADHIDNPKYPFKTYLVKDRSVNAFAIPDGHIFINLGTILFARDIDELASVIGHEMGHCQLRHISQSIDAQKRISTATIAGILAGAILSSQNPEAGTALILSSLGGSQNLNLAYTRKHEYEADEFSTRILEKSGYDPSGMTRFLIGLRTYSGHANIPEYLLTHPYTQDRIIAVGKKQKEPSPDERYWVLVSTTAGLLLPEDEVITRSKRMPPVYRALARGLMYSRLGQDEKAIELLEDMDLPQARSYLGLSLYRRGEKEKAYSLLDKDCVSAGTALALSSILDERGEAKRAIDVLVPFERDDRRVGYRLGSLYENSGDMCMSHVSFARYFVASGDFEGGLYHVDAALGYCDKEDLKKELEELKKKLSKKVKKSKRG